MHLVDVSSVEPIMKDLYALWNDFDNEVRRADSVYLRNKMDFYVGTYSYLF